jgi:hypothetical protein
MHRQAAVGAMKDRIKVESSGKAEWPRRTKSNNSLNRSGISLDFIRKIEGLIQYFPPG